MSYILEALKKAEAERESGQVPHLGSQSTQVPWPATPSRAASRWPLGAAIALLVVCLLAVVAWMARGPSPMPMQGQATVAVPGTLAQPSAATAAPPALAQSMLSGPRPSTRQPFAPPPVMFPNPVRMVPRPLVPDAALVGLAHSHSPQGLASEPAAASSLTGIVAFAQLPQALQAQLPKLNFGGAMYSDEAAKRMLFVNGQLLHEGDEVAPGVRLETIQLRSAVMRYQNYRYRIDY